MNKNMKRTIIMALIYSIGIGGISLIIGTLIPINYVDDITKSQNDSQEVLNINNEDTKEDLMINAKEDNKSIRSMSINKADAASTQVEPTKVPTEAATPTPTPLPLYALEQEGYPEIEKFFLDYYVAKNCCDYDQIKTLVTDPDNISSLEYMEVEAKFLDDIRDITCYVMKSYEDGNYIVYVTYETKYVNLQNTYPMLDKFYLITDDKGELKIETSIMDEKLKTYYDDRDQDEKVQELYESIDYKQKEVLNRDSDLRIYLDALYNIFD